jgi:hypothetical protein
LGVNNVSPTGSVGGLVVDAATMKPMEGVKVTVIAGGKQYPPAETPATTDAGGYFAVDAVPTGNLIVLLVPGDPAAYRQIAITATMPNAAGEFPLGNATLSLGPIGMVPLTTQATAFSIQLVTPDGAPAASGIKAHLRAGVEWVNFANGSASPKGIITTEASTDNSGMLNFVGMPDFHELAGLVGTGGISDNVKIEIPPFDSNKDGVLDFWGMEETFNVTQLTGAVPTIVLIPSHTPTKLTIEAASIAALAGMQGNRVLNSVSGPIFVTFNLPINQALTEVHLYDEIGLPVITTPSKTVTANVLTLNIPGLKEGAEYNLNLRTFSDVGGIMLEGYFGAPFFTPTQPNATFNANLTRDSGDPNKIIVTFSEPVGAGIPGKHLSGSNAVLYFDYDLNGSGVKGDSASERNSTSSDVNMMAVEVDPPGPAGQSGLSSSWYFNLPVDTMSNPVPGGTAVDILFSKASFAVQRANGALVPDLKNVIVPNPN